MTLVLKTLRSNETLDTGSFCIWLLAFTFRLDFAADDELANLYNDICQHYPSCDSDWLEKN